MQALLLRFDAPLMSFGGVMVDQHGPTDRFPGLSLLAGLLGNALGLRHRDADALQALQARIQYAARWDIPPKALLDYHTVDLGQPKMREPGWTTRGIPEHREGGEARYGTSIRYRHYWADGVMTLALGLLDQNQPSLSDLAAALAFPARPLFIGRKTCLPAAPLLLGTLQAPDLLAALRRAPRATHPQRPVRGAPMEACWPIGLGVGYPSREVALYDRRDWHNQFHAGRRLRMEGLIEEETP